MGTSDKGSYESPYIQEWSRSRACEATAPRGPSRTQDDLDLAAYRWPCQHFSPYRRGRSVTVVNISTVSLLAAGAAEEGLRTTECSMHAEVDVVNFVSDKRYATALRWASNMRRSSSSEPNSMSVLASRNDPSWLTSLPGEHRSGGLQGLSAKRRKGSIIMILCLIHPT